MIIFSLYWANCRFIYILSALIFLTDAKENSTNVHFDESEIEQNPQFLTDDLSNVQSAINISKLVHDQDFIERFGGSVILESHEYYHGRIYFNRMQTEFYFNYINDAFAHSFMTHVSLSNKHRIAVKFSPRFTFLFYGHLIENLTIATGGFLYMSDFLHVHLTYSQYIAPLMADFDTSLGGDRSEVKYADSDEYFVVYWENVRLKDNPTAGEFSFTAILMRNGTIVFAYHKLPGAFPRLSGGLSAASNATREKATHEKSSSKSVTNRVNNNNTSADSPVDTHFDSTGVNTSVAAVSSNGALERPGMAFQTSQFLVGISDAYYEDVPEQHIRRIVEYNSLQVALEHIRSGAVVVLTPNPTCVEQRTCEACLSSKVTRFRCSWCPTLQQCSSGVDRHWQRWRESGCKGYSVVQSCASLANHLSWVIIVLLVASSIGLVMIALCWSKYLCKNPRKRCIHQLRRRLAALQFLRKHNFGRDGMTGDTSDMVIVCNTKADVQPSESEPDDTI